MFFGKKETPEDKREKEVQKFLKENSLDEVSENDLQILRRISSDLAGLNLLKAGLALSFAKAEEQAKVAYLSALVDQNWIIIRKLDEISKKLDNTNNPPQL
ncbi:hypothetical protein [Brevibacillus choshinensis]|uniref:Uncharacterized protein n=1 Tax=Brevibacillus choshinensis TaxID=54911 RepID=A0ABX7FQU0_BRECH|nr:hypothetical protein [Brevibacillus choshinensis]QRG68623.1 hypothetical protein JNE38_05585 [Brevibacillus choshinensis]